MMAADAAMGNAQNPMKGKTKSTPGMPMKWVVHFAVHDEALVAIKTCSKTDPQLWGGLDTLYNERPYNERGW